MTAERGRREARITWALVALFVVLFVILARAGVLDDQEQRRPPSITTTTTQEVTP